MALWTGVCTLLAVIAVVDSQAADPYTSGGMSGDGGTMPDGGTDMTDGGTGTMPDGGDGGGAAGAGMDGSMAGGAGMDGYGGCESGKKSCYANEYDSTGEWIGSKEVCTPQGDDCACDTTREHRCTMNDQLMGNYSWCALKAEACPCTSPQKDCFQYTYDSDGSMAADYTSKCVTQASECTCGTGALPTACEEGASMGHPFYVCLSAAQNTACPVSCLATQVECYGTTYDSTGQMDYTAPMTKTCVSAGTTCPCDATWELSCTSEWGSWCSPKSMPCPLTCSSTEQSCYGFSYHANGTNKVDAWGMYEMAESCAPANAACPCDATNEISCTQGDAGMEWSSCFSKKDYPNGCPVNCATNGSVTCYPMGYDSTGMPSMISNEVCKPTWDDCMGLCGANSKKCGTGYSSYCIWSGDTNGCPVDCTEDQGECWIDKYDATGNWEGSTKKCVKAGETCPCADGAHSCKDMWGSWCQPTSMACPITCAEDTEKLCSAMSFTAAGLWDDSATIVESCVKKDKKCPCGANAIACSETDSWSNMTYDYCMPTVSDGVTNACPVTCTAKQEMCMVENYDTSGKLTGYKEKCQKIGAECPCGTEAQRCTWNYAGMSGSYCQPNFDMFEKTRMSCPVSCTSSQEICSVPKFDAAGLYLSSTETCVATGASCDCTKGQNAKACGSECIFVNDYCPVTCTGATKEQCPPKDNFKANAEWISSTAPAKGQECKAKLSDCACGLEAKMCKVTFGGVEQAWCQPKVFPCPVQCASTEKLCSVVNYDDAGNIVSSHDQCAAKADACPCGDKNTKCKIDGTLLCMPLAAKASVCPCKTSEDTCFVQDFDTNAKGAGTRAVCIPKGSTCPCGKNAMSCSDEQEVGAKICMPKFGKTVKACPKPCGPSQETAGNVTCIKQHLDTKGEPTGVEVTCVVDKTCTPGRGQKKCSGTGATIASSYSCKNLYGLKIDAAARRLGNEAGRSRHLATVSSGSKQTVSLSFTLTAIKGADKDVGIVKVKLDSIVMLQPEIQTTFSMVKSGTKASMLYKITNLGASKVTPLQVAEKLRGLLNSKASQTKTALATLGNVQLGGSGCCSITSDIKVVVDRTQPVSTQLPGKGTATAGSVSALVSSAFPPASPFAALLATAGVMLL